LKWISQTVIAILATSALKLDNLKRERNNLISYVSLYLISDFPVPNI